LRAELGAGSTGLRLSPQGDVLAVSDRLISLDDLKQQHSSKAVLLIFLSGGRIQ